MNLEQRIVHERLLRELPVKTVVNFRDQADEEDEFLEHGDSGSVVGRRQARILRFMQRGIRYRGFELGGVVGLQGNCLHMLLVRMVERGVLRRSGTRRRYTYFKP